MADSLVSLGGLSLATIARVLKVKVLVPVLNRFPLGHQLNHVSLTQVFILCDVKGKGSNKIERTIIETLCAQKSDDVDTIQGDAHQTNIRTYDGSGATRSFHGEQPTNAL
jgi:hypothetical protein